MKTEQEMKDQFQAKEQLSVKQSHELIRLRKELQENKQKNVILLQENEELKNATVTLAEGLNFQQERADKLEQECEKLINQRDKFEFGNNILEHERNNYKQALDEIELYCNKYPTNSIGFKQSILNIINKAKEQ